MKRSPLRSIGARLPRLNRHVAVLLIALVFAGVAVYLTLNFLNQQKDQYQQALHTKLSSGKVAAVVPKSDYPAGTVLTSQRVAKRMYPKKFMYPGSITTGNWGTYAGRAVKSDVAAGKPLRKDDFQEEQANDFAATLNADRRAVTITVDNINSISGMVQPGDRIDIVMISDQSTENGGASLVPVLHHVEVLATGSRIKRSVVADRARAQMRSRGQPGADLSHEYGTVTLNLTPGQASDLILARSMGSLEVALGPTRMANASGAMPIVTQSDLMRRLLGEKKPGSNGTEKPQRPKIEFIVGSRNGVSSRVAYGNAPSKQSSRKAPSAAERRGDRKALGKSLGQSLGDRISGALQKAIGSSQQAATGPKGSALQIPTGAGINSNGGTQ